MQKSRFVRYAWGVLIYNVAVILWGALVRATGSGAGCGSHWPLCNGVVIPRAQYVATVIEFTHRLMSGGALILVGVLLVWAFRAFPKRHRVRFGAIWSMVFIIFEALIGAGLVLLGLTADNSSGTRAVVIAIHLVNTFLLLAALTLTVWWASGGAALRFRRQGVVAWLLAIGIFGALALGATGAITALGDTLFPATSLSQGFRQDVSPTAHFLLRLRIYHPALATLLGIYLVVAAWGIVRLRPHVQTRRFARLLTVLFLIQLGVGGVNVIFLAPVWMQLIHLFLADLVWIALVLLSAAALADQPVEEPLLPQLRAASRVSS